MSPYIGNLVSNEFIVKSIVDIEGVDATVRARLISNELAIVTTINCALVFANCKYPNDYTMPGVKVFKKGYV
ncbi:uncharacterized protein METZ01_LOCUS415594 [marine metagenome]|uniref:Uncharacterized protein n=1 Tax=marine metagenome TaxID=408172 RepID=A0A382WVY6_9ZZZZ